MAYNTSKGPRDLGDLKNEDDVDTQIDWDDDKITFKTNNTARFVVDNDHVSGSGGLEIVGATALGGALNVSGTVTFAGGTSHDGGVVFNNVGADVDFRVATPDDPAMLYVDGGNSRVGIGLLSARSPDAVLEVVGSGDSLETLRLKHAGSVYGSTNPFISLNYANVSTLSVYTDGANDVVLKANHESLHLDTISGKNLLLQESGGKIGIGTTNPTHKLTVAGDISGSGVIQAVGAAIFGSTMAVSGAVTLSGPTTGSVAGPGSYLGVNSSGLLILDEAGGSAAVTSYTNATNNRVLTSVDSSTINGEANLTFNGSLLQVGGVVSASSDLHAVGDVTCGATLATTGSFTCSGSIRGKQIHITRHGYNGGGTGERFIPFYTLTDTSAPGSADENAQMVMPFDGILKRVIFRPTGAQGGGSSRVALYKQTDGTSLIGDGDIIEHLDVTCSGVAATSNVFNFTGSSHFSAGDVVGVSIDPHLGPADTWVTCVWELEMFGI